MVNKKDLSHIGIGTWGIGGFAERNPQNDDKEQVNTLCNAFQSGLNYLDLNLWYAEGHSVQLVLEAFQKSGLKREQIFITQKFYPFSINTIEDAKTELDYLRKLFKTDYIDSIEITTTLYDKLGFEKSIDFVKYAIKNGGRYTNITNPSLEQLKIYHKIFGEKLFASEAGFNFEIRDNYDLGILPYATDNNILNIIYQPLRRNRTANRNYPLLYELSQKYKKTQNQILLNWISSCGYLPLVKTGNIEHLKENLLSFDFILDENDKKRLNEFRVKNYKSPKIFYTLEGTGTRIDQLSNIFDEEYTRQNPR